MNAESLDSLPPNSPEAEAGILACLLKDIRALTDSKRSGLIRAWFYEERNREIFDAIETTATEHGTTDPIVVSETLRKAGKLDGIGGLEFLLSLDSKIPSAANAPYYLRILRERFQERASLGAHAMAGKIIGDPSLNPAAKLRGLDDALVTIRAALAPDVGTIAKALSDLPSKQKSDPGELLKFRFLCRGGGLLFVGPTGVGKSSLGMQAAILWGLERPCFGITPARPLRSLIVQAENDEGDLGEMRDGVFAGMALTADEEERACRQILTVREDARTAGDFLALTIEPLLVEYAPDLLWIDPVLAYLGASANDQAPVGQFLRNGLNPLLHKYGCACVLVHHSNKPPSGREKPDWAGSDFAYLGAGSAEWANWSRAVLALRAIGQQGVFELRAGKRGSRLGWKDADGATAYTKFLGHSNEPGVICWREVDAAEVNTGGRPNSYGANELWELLPDTGMTTTEWQQEAKAECGIAPRTFFRLKRQLEGEERVLKSKIDQRWKPIKPGKLP